jgi:carboxyl-terminal processing protease
LQVARESAEETLEISVERAEIDIPVLRTKVEDGVFIISIYSFSADLDDRFRGALREYQDSSADSLIIDLRNNPGGYLMSAVELGSWFADAGEVLVRERLGSSSSQDNRLYRSKGYYLEKLRTEPLAVLVNQGSASASEIFAGIIQDYDLGVVIGENTFGKGSVQELIPLRGDTAIKITTARWLTPNGRSISDGGLEPDVIIEDDQETVEIDEQLDKALDLLKSN